MVTILRQSILAALLTSFAFAQPTLRLKNRQIATPDAALDPDQAARTRDLGPGHVILQFNAPPDEVTIAALADRGIQVLQYVPENALLVSIARVTSLGAIDVRYIGALEPVDKMSPLIAGAPADSANNFVVEFHPDVDMNYARGLLLNLGLELRENADLNPRHLLIHAESTDALQNVTPLDEVAYIFPASEDLASGTRSYACAGAVAGTGPIAQFIPLNGPGWDGSGLNATSLGYVFGTMTTKMASGTPQSEIRRAMAEWSKVINLTWTQGSNPTANRTVNIFFASGAHGDGYPFDGPYGVLAHTFYPAPPNPEPIAGDMHFDADEAWHQGSNIDLFSVALHELGHALGLGHSDSTADVMYPYYKIVSTLAAGDKSAVLQMYAPAGSGSGSGGTGGTGGGPSPLTLWVTAPGGTTTASSLNLAGTASGGTGAITVTWSANAGSASGTATGSSNWSIAGIPLAIGSNTIVVTAQDSATSVSQTLTITRTTAPPPTPRDTTAPALTVTFPASTTYTTSSTSLLFTGTASDNVGVKVVTWLTNTGATASANGTSSWSAPIPLLVGSNTITIKAFDAAGNYAWRTVMVTRK